MSLSVSSLITARTALLALVVGVAVANVVRSAIVPDEWHLAFNIGIAVYVAGLAWASDLTAVEVGLDPHTLARGLRWGAAAFAVISIATIAGGVLGIISDDRADVAASTMLLRVLVVIPIGTVIMEELLFRGVLHGSLSRVTTPGVTVAVGAALFGLWHVFPALRGSAPQTDVVDLTKPITVLATFVVTALFGLALLWLRVKSQNLIAPIMAHIATNSVTFFVAWLFR